MSEAISHTADDFILFLAFLPSLFLVCKNPRKTNNGCYLERIVVSPTWWSEDVFKIRSLASLYTLCQTDQSLHTVKTHAYVRLGLIQERLWSLSCSDENWLFSLLRNQINLWSWIFQVWTWHFVDIVFFNVHWDEMAVSCEELTHWKRLWCWEGLGAGGEGDARGWDGWMASLTRWTWVWVNSRSWWWTGRPGVLWFMRSQRVGHDWATKLNWTELRWENRPRKAKGFALHHLGRISVYKDWLVANILQWLGMFNAHHSIMPLDSGGLSTPTQLHCSAVSQLGPASAEPNTEAPCCSGMEEPEAGLVFCLTVQTLWYWPPLN